MTDAVASLGMYPLAHVREHWDLLWARIRKGIDDAPDELSWDLELTEAWRHPSLLVGATCGWPLVNHLGDEVVVLGAFDPAVPFAASGHYRSVLVAAKPWSFTEWQRIGGATAAVNSHDSLSGWVSLCAAWGGRPELIALTGSHVESLRAVSAGRAQVASIDAVTFELVAEVERPMMSSVHVVGHGPSVPALPLVCAARFRDRVPELRAAIGGAVGDPALAATCAALRIRGFVPFDRVDYTPVLGLTPAA